MFSDTLTPGLPVTVTSAAVDTTSIRVARQPPCMVENMFSVGGRTHTLHETAPDAPVTSWTSQCPNATWSNVERTDPSTSVRRNAAPSAPCDRFTEEGPSCSPSRSILHERREGGRRKERVPARYFRLFQFVSPTLAVGTSYELVQINRACVWSDHGRATCVSRWGPKRQSGP